MPRTKEEIVKDIATINHRLKQSVYQFRCMSSQLATLGRTTTENYHKMSELIEEFTKALEEDDNE